MPLESYHPCELHPRELTADQISNPLLVLSEFFDFAHLPQHRQELKQLVEIVVTGSYSRLSIEERGDVIYYFRLFEKLIEAAHLIHKNSSGKAS